MGYLKAVILFSDGESFCPYVKNDQCSIYDNRPSICRVYPLSPNIDDKIYLDDNCPAIDAENGNEIIRDGIVSKDYMYDTLENYQDKYIQTHLELEKINKSKDFESVLTVNQITFFKYIGKTKNKYITYHKLSLKNNSFL